MVGGWPRRQTAPRTLGRRWRRVGATGVETRSATYVAHPAAAACTPVVGDGDTVGRRGSRWQDGRWPSGGHTLCAHNPVHSRVAGGMFRAERRTHNADGVPAPEPPATVLYASGRPLASPGAPVPMGRVN
eukprot:TRINITY_DN6534_c0_g1_i1.p6 TRINITY_DN6534_c0_g1~~TRINITY_DN6534_c0_g1_i1.p6  ORF type:complete len:130 (+),score=4.79 TRINITY_DN6534_c0_g1_i1:300-689(+)